MASEQYAGISALLGGMMLGWAPGLAMAGWTGESKNGRKQVPRFARNDRQKGEGKGKGKGKSKYGVLRFAQG